MIKLKYDKELLFDSSWIRNKAEIALKEEPVHITDVEAPMSEGGKNDFYSNGDYWWPNPDTEDGLPYIRHDGLSNPDCFNKHRLIIRKMKTNVSNLAAGYLFTGDEGYAEKAVQFLKEFFVDESTKMNPNLLYAQAIPGICSGRGIGIIDTLHLIDIPMAITALAKSSFMDKKVLHGLMQWFSNYLQWMSNHSYGIQERDEGNNHGICWHVQAASFAVLTENKTMLDYCREHFKNVLLPDQMAPNGSFPRELQRTKPYGYSVFTIDNMATLCHILSDEKENLWEFELNDGRGMRKGIEFIYKYVFNKEEWPYGKDIEHFESWPAAFSFLLFAGIGLGEKRYIDLWKNLDNDPKDDEVRRNMAVCQPCLWLI